MFDFVVVVILWLECFNSLFIQLFTMNIYTPDFERSIFLVLVYSLFSFLIVYSLFCNPGTVAPNTNSNLKISNQSHKTIDTIFNLKIIINDDISQILIIKRITYLKRKMLRYLHFRIGISLRY